MNEVYDAIIVGSGAGGSAVAYRLAKAGKRVLLLEKGEPLPRDGSTLDVKQVFKEGRFKNQHLWVDGHNKMFVPGEYHNVGGKTKWCGAALLRFAPHEFAADHRHQCRGWPVGYDEIAPYYGEAEELLKVKTFQNEPELQVLLDRICEGDGGWRPEALPLGLSRAILEDENEAKHFDGFASACRYKSDAEWNLLDLVKDEPGFTILTGRAVTGFSFADGDPTTITGVRCGGGTEYRAGAVVLAAGAMTSPRLLEDHLNDHGLDERLPAASNVGANFKLHINTALLAFSPFKRNDVLRKTAIIFNERFPHSTVQCLGWIDGEILGTQLPGAVPKFVTNALGMRVYGFFVTTEDGSHPENRIISCGGKAMPVMDYDLARLKPADAEHKALNHAFTARLARAGLVGVHGYIGLAGTAHALGSMVTGGDPSQSVTDRDGRVHGMANLYVGDGGVLPRSSRVNPALTIYAWGLRLGDHLAGRRSS